MNLMISTVNNIYPDGMASLKKPADTDRYKKVEQKKVTRMNKKERIRAKRNLFRLLRVDVTLNECWLMNKLGISQTTLYRWKIEFKGLV